MKWKKSSLLSAAMLALLLTSACSNKTADEEKEKNPPGTPAVEEEEIIIPALSDEAFYEEVHNALAAADLAVSEPLEAPVQVFDAESGMTLVVNHETILPLHLYKLRADDPRLADIEKTGAVNMAIGSKTEKLDVLTSGRFIMYVHQGHPDYDRILSVISAL